MAQDLQALYRLTVLYLISLVDFQLTRTQVCNFFLDKEYTNYLKIQEIVNNLIHDGLLSDTKMRNRTLLALTEEGKRTLEFCADTLSPAIREDVLSYLRENKMQFKNEVSIQSNYYKLNNGYYETNLCAKEAGNTLIQIKFTVPTEELAETVSENWQKKNASVYQYLTNELF